MVDILTLQYKVIYIDSGGGKNVITDYIENLCWEENQNEISVRTTFNARNDKVSKKYLSSIVKPNGLIIVQAKDANTSFEEVARGKVVDWTNTNQSDLHTLKCTCYDDLYNLQKSQDNFLFLSGVGTKARLNKVLGAWGMSLSKYEGANASHGKKKYQNRYVSDVILHIIDDARKKTGGAKCVFRQSKGKIEIVKRGSNKNVYVFTSDVTEMYSNTISTADLITRVKVFGKEKKSGKQKVLATLNGKTEYGIRQRIYTRGSDESVGDAKSAAQTILDKGGKVDKEVCVKTPDVPYIRKGDIVQMDCGSVKGDYYVLSISHDADNFDMLMTLKKKG